MEVIWPDSRTQFFAMEEHYGHRSRQQPALYHPDATMAPSPKIPAHIRVATWLSIGELTLTLCRSTPESFDYRNELPVSDAFPDLHFVQSSISRSVGELGLRLFDIGKPAILVHESQLEDVEHDLLRRIHKLPVQEKIWCFDVLLLAYESIKDHIEKALDIHAAAVAPLACDPIKTLPTKSCDMLHIDRLTSCHPQQRQRLYDEDNDRRLAFLVTVHIHAHSQLATFFRSRGLPERGPSDQGASSTFAPPD